MPSSSRKGGSVSPQNAAPVVSPITVRPSGPLSPTRPSLGQNDDQRQSYNHNATAPYPVPPKRPQKRRELNIFLFDILNHFKVEEFHKYTNFPGRAIMAKYGSAADAESLGVKLTEDFYRSEAAKRIFKEIYGLKEPIVVLNDVKRVKVIPNVVLVSPKASKLKIGPKSKVQQLTQSREETFQRQPDHPKEVPLQSSQNIASKSLPAKPHSSDTFQLCQPRCDHQTHECFGISAAAVSRGEFSRLRNDVDHLNKEVDLLKKLVLVQNDEMYSNRVATSSQGFEEPLKLSSVYHEHASKPKIGPKSKIQQLAPIREETIQRQPDRPKDVPIPSQNRASRPKIGSKPNVPQRTSRNVCIHKESGDLLVHLPGNYATNVTTQNVAKIGPKSGMTRSKSAPVNSPTPSELQTNFKRSVDIILKRAAEKYLAETDSNVLSLKHFLFEFLKSELENDSSAVQLGAQSQVVSRQDHVQNGDNIQKGVESSRAGNIDEMRMEPQPSLVDSHPYKPVRVHSGGQVRVKIEKFSEGDSNETFSSSDAHKIPDSLHEGGFNTEKQSCVPFLVPQPPMLASKKKSPAAGSSTGFDSIATLSRPLHGSSYWIEYYHRRNRKLCYRSKSF